jgi:hypothetical protein
MNLNVVLDVSTASFHDVIIRSSGIPVMFNGSIVETVSGAAGRSLLGPVELSSPLQ